MPEARLWQWAKEQGYTPEDLADALGYTSPRYVELVLRGWEKMSDSFIGRFVQAYPQEAYFLLNLSEKSDTMPENQEAEPCTH